LLTFELQLAFTRYFLPIYDGASMNLFKRFDPIIGWYEKDLRNSIAILVMFNGRYPPPPPPPSATLVQTNV
jgi:hypothetical protein